MLVEQLKLYLTSDRIEEERRGNEKAEAFFKKWKVFIISQLSRNEITELLKVFRYTKWYEMESLGGDWGDLLAD